MNFKTISFKEVGPESWDEFARRLGESGYAHSWNCLHFGSQLPGVVEHDSFLLLENGIPVALCPLAFSVLPGSSIRELSLAGRALGVPALATQLKPSARRKLLDQIFAIYQEYVDRHQIAKAKIYYHPLTVNFNQRDWNAQANIFELQRYHFIPRITNTLVMDLGLSEEALNENISKYHRRHIKRGLQGGQKVKAFDTKQSTESEIREQMKQFQAGHLLAAGRATQADLFWGLMTESILRGVATLFVSFLGEIPISYLYCVEYEKMAHGASQANLPEFEEEHSPRHLLEWQAILYYKQKDLHFYEVGDRFYGPQLSHVPSAKEISISEFKERYGGFLAPKVEWTGYFQRELMVQELQAGLADFLQNQTLSMLAPKKEISS